MPLPITDDDITMFLASRNIRAKPRWVTDIRKHIEEKKVADMTKRQFLGKVYKAWLQLDITDTSESTLPPESDTAQRMVLKASVVLQVDAILDVSMPVFQQILEYEDGNGKKTGNRSRVLKLQLTDGHKQLVGIERTPITGICRETLIGIKVRLTNVVIRDKAILLEPENIVVLGGKVPAEKQANDHYLSILYESIDRPLSAKAKQEIESVRNGRPRPAAAATASNTPDGRSSTSTASGPTGGRAGSGGSAEHNRYAATSNVATTGAPHSAGGLNDTADRERARRKQKAAELKAQAQEKLRQKQREKLRHEQQQEHEQQRQRQERRPQQHNQRVPSAIETVDLDDDDVDNAESLPEANKIETSTSNITTKRRLTDDDVMDGGANHTSFKVPAIQGVSAQGEQEFYREASQRVASAQSTTMSTLKEALVDNTSQLWNVQVIVKNAGKLVYKGTNAYGWAVGLRCQDSNFFTAAYLHHEMIYKLIGVPAFELERMSKCGGKEREKGKTLVQLAAAFLYKNKFTACVRRQACGMLEVMNLNAI